jgi:hypothetical protein
MTDPTSKTRSMKSIVMLCYTFVWTRVLGAVKSPESCESCTGKHVLSPVVEIKLRNLSMFCCSFRMFEKLSPPPDLVRSRPKRAILWSQTEIGGLRNFRDELALPHLLQ